MIKDAVKVLDKQDYDHGEARSPLKGSLMTF